jgi:oxalate decarboxylase/phosphoglucose isomerase-like protein (cupin superfamily)
MEGGSKNAERTSIVRLGTELSPFGTPSGEVVREVFGKAVGPGFPAHSLAHITIPPKGASLLHYHPVAEESYYLLAGKGRMTMQKAREGQQRPEGEPQEWSVGPGDAVLVAPSTWHQICNVSDSEDLIFIAVCVPPWTPDCSVFASS